jgi:DNA-binding NarL/FixJ family response regulator
MTVSFVAKEKHVSVKPNKDGEPVNCKSEHASPGLSRVVRVLVVEDFAPIREFICLALGKRLDLRVIGVATDGLEAVQKAAELKPDLVLMDIGLPSLNGIEAARRIRKLVPESRIIFLTQESSAEFVQEAMSLGAQGYVVKANARRELLPAIANAISQKQFFNYKPEKPK